MRCKHQARRDAQTGNRFCIKCGRPVTNRNYKNGSVFEGMVKRHFEKKGYLVFRSAGSHGIADVIAMSQNGSVILIQCKKSGIFPRDEINKLIQASKRFPYAFLLADHKQRGRITFTNLAGQTIEA